MYWCMTTSMYCLYVGVDYTYIDVNALAQGIKSFMASQVWLQAVAGARTYGNDSPAITSQPHRDIHKKDVQWTDDIRGDQKPRGPPLTCLTLWANLALASMYWCMTTSMYCLYVGIDYTYIDVNALAQGIKSFLASHVWFQGVAGARTYGTDSPAITSHPR